MSDTNDVRRQIYDAEMRLAAIAENRARAMQAGSPDDIAALLSTARLHIDRARRVWDEIDAKSSR